MATITASPLPLLGHVYVEVNVSDWAGAECVQVVRVIDATGERAPLRTYVWTCAEFGEFLHLSDGMAIFWDTEAPLDQPFHYEATAMNVLGVPVGEMGVYGHGSGGLVLPGTAGSYASTPDNAALDIVGDIDLRADATLADWQNPLIEQAFSAKYNTTGNQRSYRLEIMTDGTVTIAWSTAGAAGIFVSSTVSVLTRVADGGRLAVRATLDVDNGAAGNTVTFYTAPNISGPWTQLGAPVVTGGVTSIFNSTSILEAGGTSVATFDVPLGTIHALEVRNGIDGTVVAAPYFFQQPSGTTSFVDSAGRTWTLVGLAAIVHNRDASVATSASLTLDSLGGMWLRDPFKPCNDRRIVLCYPNRDPACVPGDETFYVRHDDEQYANSGAAFLATNAKRPIGIMRERQDASTQLVLITRTFTARDNLLATLSPGDVLQWSGLAEHGVPDRYCDVQDVTVSRMNKDMRFQARGFQLPYITEDRPVGPAQGVCGSRFMDLCDGAYDTWAEVTAAGVTYGQLIAGKAGASPPDLGFQTYTQVAAAFANFTAAASGNTYTDLLEGT